MIRVNFPVDLLSLKVPYRYLGKYIFNFKKSIVSVYDEIISAFLSYVHCVL